MMLKSYGTLRPCKRSVNLLNSLISPGLVSDVKKAGNLTERQLIKTEWIEKFWPWLLSFLTIFYGSDTATMSRKFHFRLGWEESSKFLASFEDKWRSGWSGMKNIVQTVLENISNAVKNTCFLESIFLLLGR